MMNKSVYLDCITKEHERLVMAAIRKRTGNHYPKRNGKLIKPKIRTRYREGYPLTFTARWPEGCACDQQGTNIHIMYAALVSTLEIKTAKELGW